jgi:hypothetical protein
VGIAVMLTVVVMTTTALALANWHARPSSAVDLAKVRTSLFLMDTAATGAKEAEAPPLLPESPWLSPQGLEGPPATTVLPGRAHVRVVVRAHHAHAHLTRGLLEQLRYQATAEGAPATVDFALVATEPRGLNVTRELAAEAWAQGRRDAYAVFLPEAFWLEAKQRSAAYACTPAETLRFKQDYGVEGMRRICIYDNMLYYLVRY